MADYNDEKMACYIWDILKRSIKTFSWGVNLSTVQVIKLGTEFHVNGFIVKGIVRIEYDEGLDLFKVTIIPDDGTKATVIEEVYFDMLVDVIDEHVEHCENYEQRICSEYGIAMDAVVG